MQLVDRLGWRIESKDQADGPRTVMVRMASRVPTVLVIDDNEGLVKLIERFLTHHAYRVVSAANGSEGLRLVQELLPDAVMLDVMMPEMSGWEVLQRLRNHPKSLGIPVIVCSVFDNPQLAYSLGASLFLPKPVSRDDVLSALDELELT
jgi:CheY-like chemotaxis protein